jgi:hypothetical protein
MKLPPEICEKRELEISDMDNEKVNLDLFFKFLNKQVVSNGQRSSKLNKEVPRVIMLFLHKGE